MTSESISSSRVPAASDNANHSGEAVLDEALAGLPERPPSAPVETWLLHGNVPEPGQPVVLITQTALLQVAAHSESNLAFELGGALLGHACRRGENILVEIKAALPAISQDHGPVHFTFSADSWSRLHADRAAHYPDMDIVGWFHTHPDLGVFYSSDDVIVHSAAFTLPWHIGLVVDPSRQEAGFFGWVQGKLGALSGYYEVRERQPEPIVPWRAVRSGVWDHPYTPLSAPSTGAETSRVYLPAGERPSLALAGREGGLLLGALALLGLLLVSLVFVLPLRQQVNQLQSAVITLGETGVNAPTCPDARLRLFAPANNQAFPVGSRLDFIGTAAYPTAARYQIDVRPTGVENWTLVGRQGSDAVLGQLARWDSAGYPPGLYEFRLAAVDINNIRLADSPTCLVTISLVP